MIFWSLLGVFAFLGAFESATADIDLTKVQSLVDQLNGQKTQLQAIITAATPGASQAQAILDAIDDLPTSTDRWSDFMTMMSNSVDLYFAASPTADEKAAGAAVSDLVKKILTDKSVTEDEPDLALPVLLVTSLVQAVARKLMPYADVAAAFTSLSGSGKDDKETLVDVLNKIIAALTKDVSASLKDRFATLSTQLTAAAAGPSDESVILNILKCLIPAVKMYKGTGADNLKALMLWVMAAMPNIIGGTPFVDAALKKLLAKALAP